MWCILEKLFRFGSVSGEMTRFGSVLFCAEAREIGQEKSSAQGQRDRSKRVGVRSMQDCELPGQSA